RRQPRPAELGPGRRAGQHAPGGRSRGPGPGTAPGLPRAPSRGAHPRQGRGGEVMNHRIAQVVSITLLVAAPAGCGSTPPSRFYMLEPTAQAEGHPAATYGVEI